MAGNGFLIDGALLKRIKALLAWAEPMMRRRSPAAPKTDLAFNPAIVVKWGILNEPLYQADKAHVQLWFQSNEGTWGEGDEDDVVEAWDNLLEDNQYLGGGTWVCVALNRRSGLWNVINWRGCASYLP